MQTHQITLQTLWNLWNRVGGRREIGESETEKNNDRGKWQELIGGEPWSETVDSVKKQCGYCETAVSAFSIHAGHHHTRSMDEVKHVCIPCDTQAMDIVTDAQA